MKSYECYYAMYYHHRGVKSSLRGENIIEALKKSNKNAIVVKVIDEDGTEYTVREHDDVSPDNYYDQYWVDKDDNILFDEREEKWNWSERIKTEKRIEDAKNNPPIGKDLKLRILAHDGKLLFVPNKPYENIGKGWFPVNDTGIIGSCIYDSEKNVGISTEALELMKKIPRGNDGIGDIDWFQSGYDKTYVFSWLCALYRVMDPKDCVSARGFYTHDHIVIKNDVTDEMKEGMYKYDGYRWRDTSCVTEKDLKRYKLKQKLKRIVE